MDASQDFKSVQDKVQASLVSTTRGVNQIAKEDLSFLRNANSKTGDRLDEQSTRLLGLSTEVTNNAAAANGQRKVDELEDADDVEIQWSAVVDVIDGLLEKADIALDEYTGRVKRKIDLPEPAAPSKKAKTTDRDGVNWRRANIVKPQNAFENKVDNFTTGCWKPLLTSKPHATVPLEESLVVFTDENGRDQYEDYSTLPTRLKQPLASRPQDEWDKRARKRPPRRSKSVEHVGSLLNGNEKFRYKHPYETEILNLQYPAIVSEKRDPIPSQPIDTTAPIWVDTYEGVLEMLEELKQAEVIAVDLEHHDLRSYHGLLSLMQISTRDKDWVVDTLRPWRHKLEILNEVFADPKILKVFHGAFMDIIWLQRDLGLYVVGLFDTYHGSVALNYGQKSLAYLLKKFVNFNADKKYQMADWRIRPLTDEMLYYARCDTHYLLFVFDRMRNDLLERSRPDEPESNLMEYTLQRSKETSLDRYTTSLPDSETGEGPRGWSNSLQKSFVRLDGSQFAVYRAVHAWRDNLARQEDESPQFIMPQQVLMEIAKLLPNDQKALWSLLGGKCAAKVHQSLDELFKIVKEAEEAGANGPSSVEHFRANQQGDDSMAAVAQRELSRKDKPELDLPPLEQLRSQKSQLFGSMAVSSLWESPRRGARGTSLDLIPLPWTSFVQDATASAAQDEANAKANQMAADMISLVETSAPAPPPKQEAGIEDTEFTLRQGRKRKHENVEPEASDSDGEDGAAIESQDVIALDDDDEQETPAGRKARKKAEKKAKKNATKVMRQGGNTKASKSEEEDEDDTPFDYSKAQSVLNAQRAMTNNVEDRPGRKKAFDPYAARMNAEGPKPARRLNGERSGKTATFKR